MKNREAQVPPVVPLPPPAPAMVPAQAPAPAQPAASPQVDRKQQVRAAIVKLRELIQVLSRSVFQMELKEDQLRELAQKILQELAKAVGEITTERVKQIAGDFLVVESMKRTAGIRHIGSKVDYWFDPFTVLPARIRRVSMMNGKPFYTIEIQSQRFGYPKFIEDVSEKELVRKRL